jgi:hypothetical protein
MLVGEQDEGTPLELAREIAAAIPGARESEKWRCRSQNPPGDGGDAGVAGVVGHHDRAKAPQRRNLLGIEPRRAIEPGNQDDRQAIGGIGGHGGSFVS